MRKILNVGLPRTGTQSLTEALRLLGFSVEHYPTTWDVIEAHDACTEVRFPMAKLTRKFPGSRYILTIRESRSWLASVERTWPKSTPDWNPFWSASPAEWLPLHLDRIAEVVKAVPPSDLLLMDICGGDGWDKLCSFLSLPVPDGPFPHLDAVPRWPVLS